MELEPSFLNRDSRQVGLLGLQLEPDTAEPFLFVLVQAVRQLCLEHGRLVGFADADPGFFNLDPAVPVNFATQ